FSLHDALPIYPAAAFLGLANTVSPAASRSLFNFSKDASGINASPRTSNLPVSFIDSETLFTVRKLDVISSPTCPSHWVDPYVKRPFSYVNESASPSIFNSQT